MDDRPKKLSHISATHRDRIGFDIATGRTMESARSILREGGIPDSNVLFCSAGSAMYCGKSDQHGPGWVSHIARRWNKKIVDLLARFGFLEYDEVEMSIFLKMAAPEGLLKARSKSFHRYIDINSS